MANQEFDRDSEHEACVKDVQHVLMADDETVVALCKFCNTNDITNKDHGAGKIQSSQISAPGDRRTVGDRSGTLIRLHVKEISDDNEEGKDCDLEGLAVKVAPNFQPQSTTLQPSK